MQARRRLRLDSDALQAVPGLDSITPSPLMAPLESSVPQELFADGQIPPFFSQSPALQRTQQTDTDSQHRVSMASLGSLRELTDLAELGSPMKLEHSPRLPFAPLRPLSSLSLTSRNTDLLPRSPLTPGALAQSPRIPPLSRPRHAPSSPPDQAQAWAFTNVPDLPQEVMCSFCYDPMFSVDGVPLVCSHRCHMHCLRTSISDGELPHCGICRYPAKPQNVEDFAKIEHLVTRKPLPDVLANIGTVITGVDDDDHEQHIPCEDSDDSDSESSQERLKSTLFAHSKRRGSRGSTSSSVFDSEPGTPPAQLIAEFPTEPVSGPAKVPSGESLKPWEWASAPIDVDLQIDPFMCGSASCIVSASSPADAYNVDKYAPTRTDDESARSMALEVYETAAFQGVGLDNDVTGRLRLTCQFTMSENRQQWQHVTGYLFERAIIICSYGNTGEELKTALDLREDDLQSSLWVSEVDNQLVLRLDCDVLGTPVFLKSMPGVSATALHWQAAMRDSSLYFPLTDDHPEVLKRFASQYTERPLVNIAVCVPSKDLFEIGTAVLQRLSSFDKVSFIIYDLGLVTGSHRSIWPHWADAIATPESHSYPASTEMPLAAAFQLAPTAVVLVATAAVTNLSTGAEPSTPQVFPCPVHCISLDGGANESLSQLAGKSAGSFAYAHDSYEAADCAAGAAAAERCVTHVSTCLSIVPRQSWMSNVIGWQRGPHFETYRNPQPYNLDHPRSHGLGGFMVDIGRLYAGGTVSLWIDLESELTSEPNIEITACGLMALGASKLERTRKLFSIPMNVTSGSDESPVASAMTNFWKLAHNCADSVERVLDLANHSKNYQALATCSRALEELKEARQELSNLETCPRQQVETSEAALARDMAIGQSMVLVEGISNLLNAVKADKVFARPGSTSLPSYLEGQLLECVWTLRQRQAFTRRNPVAALFSESLETNVI